MFCASTMHLVTKCIWISEYNSWFDFSDARGQIRASTCRYNAILQMSNFFLERIKEMFCMFGFLSYTPNSSCITKASADLSWQYFRHPISSIKRGSSITFNIALLMHITHMRYEIIWFGGCMQACTEKYEAGNSYPSEPFTILELGNTSIDFFELHKVVQ